MKKTILIISTVAAITTSFGQGQITNGGFENWTNSVLYDNPDYYNTGNFDWGSNISTTKETDSQHAMFSLRMESDVVGSDSIFGYALMGDAGDNGFTGGEPYTSFVDSLVGWFKYDIGVGDTGYVLSVIKDGASTNNYDTYHPITGTQSAWTRMAFPVNPSSVTPDSVIIGFVSSNFVADYIVDGSWLMVDNISYVSGGSPSAISNQSFENWSGVSAEDPDGWATFNGVLAGNGGVSVDKVTGYTSSFAAELSTILFNNGEDTVGGSLTNGEYVDFSIEGGVPYTYQPDTLMGYFMYSPSNYDTAYFNIEFWQTGGSVVSSHGYAFSDTVGAFTAFIVPLTYSGVPDSMRIEFWAGSNPGSLLTIDGLEFIGGNLPDPPPDPTDISENKENWVKVYPNPANSVVQLDLGAIRANVVVETFETSGKLVASKSFQSQRHVNIPLDGLTPGMYILKVQSDGQSFVSRLVKE